MRRIMIDASKCDGCKNCTIACMQAHRETPGTVYDLDLTDIRNESRNHIESCRTEPIALIFLQTLRSAGMRDVLYERCSDKGSENGNRIL